VPPGKAARSDYSIGGSPAVNARAAAFGKDANFIARGYARNPAVSAAFRYPNAPTLAEKTRLSVRIKKRI